MHALDVYKFEVIGSLGLVWARGHPRPPPAESFMALCVRTRGGGERKTHILANGFRFPAAFPKESRKKYIG